MDFQNLQLRRIIVHEIPQIAAAGAAARIRYSNDLARLNPEGLEVMNRRISQVLFHGSLSIPMTVVDTADGSVASRMSKLVAANDRGFIDVSRRLANSLAAAQSTRSIPDSVLVVCDGSIGLSQNPTMVLLKAEVHEGFSLTGNGGLQYLTDLFLTPGQRLYKAAIFIKDTELMESNLDYAVSVYDHNLRYGPDAARYFFRSFLGCDFSDSSKHLTRTFYETTREFINSSDFDNREKYKLARALSTYLESEAGIIQVEEFANEYLAGVDRANYRLFLDQSDFPASAVVKDTSLVEKRLGRAKLLFDNGIVVFGRDGVETLEIEILEELDVSTTIRIHGQVKEVW